MLETVSLPSGARLAPTLPPHLQRLREHVLALHQEPKPPLPEQALSDATQWAAHSGTEDWLLWRARRVAGRLETIPLDLFPGEAVIGAPRLAAPSSEQSAALAEARPILESMPPHPGGDAGHFHPNYERLFRVGVGGLGTGY